ncbi:hypothetical protein ACJIZ3_016880 [Penstemon smallii]|uniref:Uncharacterized protein n=1 Tax=Penstemon smallii TaxID=265156 RepID=A0ABD3SV54_9LAMI
MGCFLGCFGGEKNEKRRKQRINRASPHAQRKRVQNVQQESLVASDEIITETPPKNSVSELLLNKPEGEEQPSRSPKKRVTFSSNVTAYEHVVSVHESIDSLPDCNTDVEEEKLEDLKKSSSKSQSLSEDENSVTSSVGSYPPNHRYHNARDSDDEFEEYGDSDLDDDEEDELDDDEDDYDESMESRVGDSSVELIHEEVESRPPTMVNVNAQTSDEESKAFGSRMNARDRSDYINSVLNPVENITQWKAAKSKGTHVSKLPPQKENLNANFSSEPTFKSKNEQLKNKNQGVAVDASLSNWLVSPEIKKTFSEESSFADRPILGALTVEELRQINASSSPRKSPSRSPDDMPIIGTVGTYWNHSDSAKHSDSVSSYKGIPNTTSKYREDKRVNWHSTPFETRLDRALNRGAAEA